MNIKLSYHQLSYSCRNKKNDSKCNKIEELCIIIAAHMDSVRIHNSIARALSLAKGYEDQWILFCMAIVGHH
jgi:hypothetical protein